MAFVIQLFNLLNGKFRELHDDVMVGFTECMIGIIEYHHFTINGGFKWFVKEGHEKVYYYAKYKEEIKHG